MRATKLISADMEVFQKKVFLILPQKKEMDSARLLLKRPSFRLHHYQSFEEALKHFRNTKPHAVIIDPTLSQDHDEALRFITATRALLPALKCLIVTDQLVSSLIPAVFKAGADGYVTLEEGLPAFMLSVDELFAGHAPLAKSVALQLVDSLKTNPRNPLSVREQEVLRELGHGKSYAFVAEELSISFQTVKSHVSNIFVKLDVRNKSQAIAKARKLKLV